MAALASEFPTDGFPEHWVWTWIFSRLNRGFCDTRGYESIPIYTIFRGMNIHKSQLFWCELQLQGFDPLPQILHFSDERNARFWVRHRFINCNCRTSTCSPSRLEFFEMFLVHKTSRNAYRYFNITISTPVLCNTAIPISLVCITYVCLKMIVYPLMNSSISVLSATIPNATIARYYATIPKLPCRHATIPTLQCRYATIPNLQSCNKDRPSGELTFCHGKIHHF